VCLKKGAYNVQSLSWRSDADNTILNQWKNGETGIPIADANMRDLKLTGMDVRVWMYVKLSCSVLLFMNCLYI
jgi:deoxyribodipyrimidine photolyase